MGVDSAGNAYIAGQTDATDFPTKGTPYDSTGTSCCTDLEEGFISVFDPSMTGAASLTYSTYFGSETGDDQINDLTVLATGVVAVTGWTGETPQGPSTLRTPAGPPPSPFPTTSDALQMSAAGDRDAFVSRLNTSTSTLEYSTLLGSSERDEGEAIDSSSNDVYVTGFTDGTDFPTTTGAHQESSAGSRDLWVGKFLTTNTLSGSQVYTTLYGGEDDEDGRGVGVNASGEAWFLGTTYSTDFTLVSPFDSVGPGVEDSEIILGRLNSTGATMLFSSYLGGTFEEEAGGGAVAPNGDFLVTGETFSSGLGTTGSFEDTVQGGGDAIVARIGDNADLALLVAAGPGPAGESTFLAGTQITYTMSVTNNGPSTSTGVVATATLDSNLAFVSAVPTAGTCDEVSGVVTCNLGSMADSAVVMIPIVLDIDPFSASSVMSDFDVTADTFDTDLTDNVAQEITPIDYEADLSITKTDSVDPVDQGGAFSYTVTATNNGPSGVYDVVVDDTLPAEVTFVSSDPVVDGEECDLVLGVLTCYAGSMGPTDTYEVTINVTAGTGPATATNAAHVEEFNFQKGGSPSAAGRRSARAPAGFPVVPDPDTGNNDVMEDTAINGLPDLGVSGSSTPDPVTAGNNVTYNMTVENFGTASAPDSVLTATLDSNLTFVSATPGSPTCTESAGTVTCNLGSIAVSGTSNVSIVATVDPATADDTTLSTDFSVTTSGTDTDDGNDDETVQTTVVVEADLAVTKSDSQDPVNQNAAYSYTVTVTNNGPSQSPTSFLEDALSAEATLLSWVPLAACSPDGNLYCTIPSLAPGEDFAITLNAEAGPGPATITNTATLSSSFDSTPGNDQAVETTEIQANADLSLTKTDSADPADIDQPLTYTLAVTNNGPAGATGVTLIDTLPPETFFLSAAPPGANCVEVSRVVTCNLGAIASGATRQVTIQVLINGEPGATITNNAQVSGAEPDPNMSNNSVMETTLLDAQADVQITLSHTPEPITFPDPISILATVVNNGPSTVPSGSATITLPASLEFVSVVSGFSCSPNLIGVTCTFGLLPPSSPVNINIQANTVQSGSAGVTASVSSPIPDPDSGNNHDSDLFTIGAVAEFEVSKAPRFDVGASGRPFWYEIALNNLGSSTITDITLSDPLPAGQTFSAIDVVAGVATCGEAGGVVSCSIDSLGPAGTVEILLTVILSPGLSGPFTNEASASDSGGADTNPDNNSSTTAALAVAPGDINGDGAFDAADIVLLLAEVNDGDGDGVFDAAGGSVAGNPAMDVNGDNAINLLDFDALTALLF